MLISTWLTAVRNRYQASRVVKRRLNQKPAQQAAENLETRALLTAPTLVAIRPNVGDILLEGETRTVAPRELTLQFNPGQVIDAGTLSTGIQVMRGGADRTLNGVGDVPVTIGFVGIGDRPEEVIVRFAEDLPDDVYRITIFGSGTDPLRNEDGDEFNDGVDVERNFRLNLGAVVEGVVPQPVLREKLLTTASGSTFRDGDTIRITVGGVSRTFEMNSAGSVATGNTAVAFSTSSSSSQVATALQSAINSASLGVTTSRTGNTIRITGNAFTPVIERTVVNAPAVTVADGGLVQRKNMVIVHFNEDDLNPTLAQNPVFYRLFNTGGTLTGTDDVLLVPSSVVYNSVSNTSVLTFATDLPDNATYSLRIGSHSELETLSGATNIGTLLGNSYQTNGLIGGPSGSSDVDLFRFSLNSARTIQFDVAPAPGLDVVIRLFDSSLNQVALVNAGGNGIAETLTMSLNAGSFYLGLSSNGNNTYTPGNAGSTTPGTTTGSYNLQVSSLTPFVNSDANSSIGTSNAVGTVGAAVQVINGQISPQAIPLPQYPSGTDEPGHRDIPAETHVNSSGTALELPGPITQVSYWFPETYGVDTQGNTLFNAITENQKQRTREIFELWSEKTGIVANESSTGGIMIITGDLRAFAPMMPPNAASGLASAGQFAIMNANTDWGQSEYGGAWFSVGMHEIGHALGLEHSYDLTSIMGADGGESTEPVAPREPVFPTDHDTVHLQRIERPDSTDIDMYQFNVTATGRLSAEVVAERANSRLDSMLRLYDAAGNLIAQNDNYFSTDSFIGLELTPGVYYLGVSSTGNDAYNPAIQDSGFGGTTDGAYELRFSFEANASNRFLDAPLTPGSPVAEFDGDADGIAGGEFEFFFRTGTTFFVDKVAVSASGNGSLATPFRNIEDAILATSSLPGSIIRIVGNGGTDGNDVTADDASPYLIGVTPEFAILEDGGSLDVPRGVTVMIDADAVVKLLAANIDVGSSSQGIDRSEGAVQVLGVPNRPVYLTSYRNDSLGGNSDGNSIGAAGGQWGGVVFRDDSDREANGIFLNYVNKANITFGGGPVDVDSVRDVYAPIHMITARPTITYNTITNNSAAAVSANPNSFDESGDRVGPNIRGNRLINNSVNGMLVRVKTLLGEPIDKVDVQARFDDDDIVHVITENVFITGNPGGALDGVSRLSGRLSVDPGVILKVGGARIEAMIGSSNFIAEGTSERPVIITSTLDDQFGVGGTFDTTNNLSSRVAAAGDWGGLMFNATSSGSVDNAIIRFGGGRTPIEGDFNEFNVIEVHQAHVRVANSRLEFNASGIGPAGASNGRNGRGANGPATIFVRGAQPIIVGNEFRDNSTTDSFIISIDVNSLNSFQQEDRGRSTGRAERYAGLDDNLGALIRQNLMRNNGINGMEVRGGELTTQVVWDDTDIVHVLQSDVFVPNHHTYSGIRLQSRPTESLVVKLLGNTAGFTAGGNGIDIDDRIGGTVQIIGSPGFPVVMTSLHDDSVGAGFDLDGFPVLDTNNDQDNTIPNAGDWRSIRLTQFSNDRNVRVVLESENALTQGAGLVTPQLLGTLAPNEKSGDDNRPLGFEVHGHISPDTPSDQDRYTFKANAGTEVWFDLDRTGSALDSVLELVSANNQVLASSDGGVLSGLALPLQKAVALGGDHYTLNHMDEGFRVILPGSPVGTEGTYFVRVRSKNGLSSGAYRLQIRVNQRDEVPGSTVRFADMRFATNGVEIFGLPQHSPLTGEAGEGNNTANNTLGGAEFLGNLLASDRNALSVSGSLSNPQDIDWFAFTVDYQFIQAIAGVNAGGKSWATIFDIDYADGLSRPDTILSVYDSTGRLILVSRDSDVLDDQPSPGNGNSLNDLTRGSVGKLDPFIGSVQLPESTDRRYLVAVSSNGRMPAELSQTFTQSPSDTLTRLEPVTSLRRIVEDHIGFQGYSTLDPENGPVPVNPDRTEGLFSIANASRLNVHVKPFSLADVTLFSVNGGGTMSLSNPFTGEREVFVESTSDFDDIAMRPDGVLHGVLNNSGSLRVIDPATGGVSGGGDDGIPTFAGLGQDFGGMAFRQNPQVTSGGYELYVANNNSWDQDGANDNNEAGPALWRLNPSTGGLFDESPADRIQNVGTLPPGVTITGLAFANAAPSLQGDVLFAVDTDGALWRTAISINLGTGGRFRSAWTQVSADVTGTGTGFTGLTLGPQNVEDSAYASTLFATGADGNLYAFDQTGVLQEIFDTDGDGVADDSSVFFEAGGNRGLAFTPLDFNLWHPTLRRRGDAGHGINDAPDISRVPGAPRPILGRATTEAEGGASFYFGLEQWQSDPTNNGYFTYSGNAQFGVNQRTHRELSTNAAIANTYNLPGGSFGSLVTNSFSLEGYRATDRPTVYFNYFLSTENASFTDNRMRDAARVFVSTDGGTTWELIATNNSARNQAPPGTMGGAGPFSELPAYASHSGTQTPDDARQSIQELYDTGNWRQARIDLGKFAGAGDVKFRFDFTTSGDMKDPSVDGGTFGNHSAPNRSANNQFEGFYIDDIIVGFSGRGEMVTGAASLGGAFFDAPNDPSGITQHLEGEYQLEIRRGSEYGESLDPLTGNLTIRPGLLMNADQRLVSEFSLITPSASVVQDGDSYTISDGIISRTFEFNFGGGVTGTNIAVNVNANMTRGQIANALASAINGVSGFNVVATTRAAASNSEIVDLTGAMDVTTTAVAAPETLTVTAAANVAENGANSIFTVTRTGPTDAPLVVTLDALNPAGGATTVGELTDGVFSGTTIQVTIPVGATSIDVEFDPTDDAVHDGTRAVMIRATAAGMNSITDIIDVTDDDTGPGPDFLTGPLGSLQITLLQTAVGEDAGNRAVTGFVTLPDLPGDIDPFDGANPLVVTITSTDESRIRSTSTEFVDGQIRAYFSMDVLDRFFASGTSAVSIVATAPGFTSASASVNVAERTNVRFVDRLGDKNLHREQGMVIVESNTIRNFENFGIISDAAPRGAGNQTNPGSVRNLAVLNGPRLVPGVTIRNNVVANIGVGGILFSGQTNGAGQPLAPVPFGKLVNNTIYGGATATGTGIRVEQNASPTLINNIIVNTSLGIAVDASSNSTVVGTSLFKGNTVNGLVGSDAIVILPSDPLFSQPLFINPDLNNFYPAPGSPAVDSAINKLDDRPAFTAVKNPLGIPVSDLFAPDFDLFGQVRQDDPGQDTPPGLGTDIFKDRGAIERADFLGPAARFTGPAEDNNTGDLDSGLTRIHVDNLVFPTTLSLDLLDSGIGVDDLEVRSSQFELRQNGVLLVENVDYRWRYNPNNNRVYFVSVTTFPVDTRYSITIDNSAATGVQDLAGNTLQPNQADGSVVFTLLLTDGVNNAPVITVPTAQSVLEDGVLTLSTANGNAITVADQDAYLGRPEATATFTQDDGILVVTVGALDGTITLPRTTGLTITAGSAVDSSSVTFTGSIRDINAALDGLTFRPTADFFGLITNAISISAEDLGNFGPTVDPKTTIERIDVDVLPVNDAPTFNIPSAAPGILEDAGLQTVTGFMTGQVAGPPNEVLTQTITASVTVQSESSPWTTSTFFAVAPTIDPVTGNLTYRVAQDVNGTATLRVIVTDSEGLSSIARTFTLTVRAINDEPVYTRNTVSSLPIDSSTTNEDAGLISVDLINTAATARSTALDELNTQTLIWSLSGYSRTSGNVIFDVLRIRTDGTLEYKARKDTAGVATIVVNLRDNGAASAPNDRVADSFTVTINVTQINDTPVARTRNYVVDEGYSLTLDASASFDVDAFFGDTLTYRWDLNNDGIFETNAGSSPTLVRTWAQLAAVGITAPGTRTVRVRVTDTSNASSVATGTLKTFIVDYGDAPNSYGTTNASNGAAHTIAGALQLGATRDKETNGQPTVGATGDGADEDGVQFPTSFETTSGMGLQTFVDVTSTAAGKLDVWLDLNQNGVFDHATEHLNGGVSWNVTSGVNRIFFTIPANTPLGTTMMRFRISAVGSLQPTGRANTGEVEDYAVEIFALQPPVQPVITRPIDFNTADGLIPLTTDSTPTVVWNLNLPTGVNNPNLNYELIVRNQAGQTVFSRVSADNLTALSQTIRDEVNNRNLLPGRYTISLRAFNKAGEASATTTYPFEVVALQVSAPVGSVLTTRPVISWNDVPGSLSYTIQVVAKSNNATVFFRTVNAASLATPGQFALPVDLRLGEYDVRVRANDAANLPGDWSPFATFQVRVPPVITGPVGTVTTARPAITWTRVEGASRYEIQIRNLTDNTIVVERNNLTGTSFTPPVNLTLGEYLVVMRAVSATGVTTIWSDSFRFAVAPVPVIISPTGRLNDATPTFGWNAVPAADRYELEVRRAFGDLAVVYRQSSLTGTIHTITGGLPLGRYTWTVVAINDPADGSSVSSATSSSSAVTAFTVAEAPVIISPPSTTFEPRPVVTWNNPPLSPAGTISELLLDKKEGSATVRVLVQRNITGTSFTIPRDLALGTYIVRVRSYSVADPATVSEWSVARTFRVTVAPSLIGPSGSTADATPTLNWNGVLGGQTYRVIVTSLSAGTTAYDRSGINALNFTVPADLPIGRYRFIVQARSAFGDISDFSTPLDFRVVAAPTLSGPASSTFDSTPTFNWSSLSGSVGGVLTGATSYDVEIDRLSGSGFVRYLTRNVTGETFTVPSAMPAGQYQARVRGRSADTVGNFSAYLPFYVGGQPIVNPVGGTSGTTTDTTPTISWQAVDGASSYSLFIALPKVNSTDADVIVVQQGGIGATAFTVSTPLAKGTYRVWVRAINAANGQSSISSVEQTFTIVDASQVQPTTAGQRYLLTSAPLNSDEFTTDSTISMLPAFVSGTRLPVHSLLEETADASASLVVLPETSLQVTEIQPEAAMPQTDEVLSQWDSQKWWDTAAESSASQIPVAEPAEKAEQASAATGILGAILALAPRSLRRRRKDDAAT